MALPGNHTLNTIDLTTWTTSVGGTPVTVYMRMPFRGVIKKFAGILRGAITTADGLITVNNVTQGTVVGTFAVTQSGSAAGQLQSGTPATNAVSYVNEDDVLSFVPSLASGATIGMDYSVAIRTA